MMASKDEKLCLVDLIPDEIMVYIFSKLPLRDILLCVRQVCVRWYHLSKDESLWKDIDFDILCVGSEHKDKECNSKGVQKLFLEVENFMEKITFSNVPFNNGVYGLFSSPKEDEPNVHPKRLRSLDFSYSAVGIISLRTALRIQPKLQELILVHTNILYNEVMEEAIHLPCLKKLVFHDLHSWHNLLIHRQESRRRYNKRLTIQMSQHCHDLEWVELYTIWADLDNDVIQNFNQNCPNLNRLFVTWSTHITSNAFANSLACSSITHLGLADQEEREPYIHFVLLHFPNLISLTVNGRDAHTDDCMAISTFCPKLEELVFELKSLRDHDCLFDFYLHQHNSLSGPNLRHIVEGCRKIRKIHAPCSNVDDDSIVKLSLSCPLLEDVNFMHCPHLTVTSLMALSDNCQNLKCANFQHTFNPHEYVLVFLAKCPLLYEMNFDTSMSDAISLSCSPPHSPGNSGGWVCCTRNSRLQDDYSVSGLSDDIPFIDILNNEVGADDFYDQDNVSLEFASLDGDDYDVNYNPVLSNHCHIKKVSLKNANISEKNLQDIFHLCPDLTHVVLDGCLDLTNEAVITLVKCCRHIKVLTISAKQIVSNEVGDESLIEISKYSRDLEVLSILYNRNISHFGIFAIFRSLDVTLRKLKALSFCVGSQYGCKLPLRPPYGFNYLTKQAQFYSSDGASTGFRILHLEFKERRFI